MTRPLAALATVLAVVSLSACGQARDAVREGVEQASRLASEAGQQIEQTTGKVQFCAAAIRAGQAIDAEDWDAAIEAGENMADHAPEEVADEVQIVLEGARDYRAGNRSTVASPEFRDAAETLRDYTENECDPRG